MEQTYVTREQIAAALDVKPSAYMGRELDRACRAGSRSAEGLLHRIFYPEVMARTFDYPSVTGSYNMIYFDERQLITLTAASSGGVALALGNVLLRPDNIGPPYEWIELDRNSTAAFSGGPQRSTTLDGVWGFRNDEEVIGTLTAGVDSSVTLVTLSAPADHGALLRIDSERMLVVGQRWVSSGQTASALGNGKADTVLTVQTGSAFTPGERIVLDGERLEVQDIAGNVLTVRRAVDGTVLAAHAGATPIFWAHQLQVERGVLGTAAASHLTAAVTQRFVPPSGVNELSQAYAEDYFLQRNAGYARTAGTGESERQVSGRSIVNIETRVRALYGRKVRTRAV